MNKKEYLKINKKHRNVKAGLHAIGFKDENDYIIYIPSLNLSSYGDSFEEAEEMMNEVLKVFTEDLFECSETEINEILSDFGWQKEKFFPKKRVNLSTTTFEDIKRRFNLPETAKPKEFSFAI